jgi:hypothetical protein
MAMWGKNDNLLSDYSTLNGLNLIINKWFGNIGFFRFNHFVVATKKMAF